MLEYAFEVPAGREFTCFLGYSGEYDDWYYELKGNYVLYFKNYCLESTVTEKYLCPAPPVAIIRCRQEFRIATVTSSYRLTAKGWEDVGELPAPTTLLVKSDNRYYFALTQQEEDNFSFPTRSAAAEYRTEASHWSSR